MKPNLRDITMIPLMTALVAALGLVPPFQPPMLPVPITAQTLGVMLAGVILGSWRGAISQVQLLLLVAVGAPVLAGGRGGFHILVGASGGFIWGWPLGAWVIGFLTERTAKLNLGKLLVYNLLGGVGAIYAVGVPWMAMVASMPLAAAWSGSIIFLPGDAVKAVVAGALGLAVRRALRLANLGPAAHGYGE